MTDTTVGEPAPASNSPLRPSRLQLDAGASLRLKSRSPHPYHHHDYEIHQNSDVSGTLRRRGGGGFQSSIMSDSGTEADDEHFLRGLPAPKVKGHKGVRGDEELEDEKDLEKWKGMEQEMEKRKKIVVRRLAEVVVVGGLILVVINNERVALLLSIWKTGLLGFIVVYLALLSIYPLRVLFWIWRNPKCTLSVSSLQIPSDFDPAPLLYPQVIPILVAFLIAVDDPVLVVSNIVLATSTLPEDLIPLHSEGLGKFSYSSIHWLVSLIPVMVLGPSVDDSAREILSILYPLHRVFSGVLHSLTTTSLLPAELQLLSVSLLNVLLFASSPQVKILRALLWSGGLSVLIITGPIVLKGIALARIPKWRFRHGAYRTRSSSIVGLPKLLCNPIKLKRELLGPSPVNKRPIFGSSAAPDSSDDEWEMLPRSPAVKSTRKVSGENSDRWQRRRTLSVSLRPLLRLTPEQVTARKWLYAIYVYLCIPILILGPVRSVLSRDALGAEAIGWVLAYLLGDLDQFQWQVVTNNLDRWITLPYRLNMADPVDKTFCCNSGWVHHLRLTFLGPANTRLAIIGYWFVILVTGLLVVFRLSAIYEVDTRRKVFHFMMVAMFSPSIFVDPTFCAMALSFALAVFLIIDLLRASQLPPLSKPIATFLAPYVDGRDFQGPVVISHIFLLIGCAIPLWLSLSSMSRTPDSAGWEVPVRDPSMVAGVICVGLGDAAASLVGRRIGKNKWYWGGGKSLEGSIAFAAAVTVGLIGVLGWMRLGGWPKEQDISFSKGVVHAWGCGVLASVTEAVLTGGNDNVIVPVVLWMCVKAVGI